MITPDITPNTWYILDLALTSCCSLQYVFFNLSLTVFIHVICICLSIYMFIHRSSFEASISSFLANPDFSSLSISSSHISSKEPPVLLISVSFMYIFSYVLLTILLFMFCDNSRHITGNGVRPYLICDLI